jgi:hypothetical protein
MCAEVEIAKSFDASVYQVEKVRGGLARILSQLVVPDVAQKENRVFDLTLI